MPHKVASKKDAASVMDLIIEIRENLKMEIRPNSIGSGYLEAVIRKSDLELLESLLTRHLGPAAKEPGKESNFSVEIRRLVDSMGGLRIEQSFFYNQVDDNKIVYAAIWPWESNPEKITLKAGLYLPND